MEPSLEQYWLDLKEKNIEEFEKKRSHNDYTAYRDLFDKDPELAKILFCPKAEEYRLKYLFLRAAKEGDIDHVKQHYSDENAKFYDYLPFYEAIANKHIEIIKFLNCQKARYAKGNRALYLAINRPWDVCKAVISGCKFNGKVQNELFRRAAMTMNFDKIQLLFDDRKITTDSLEDFLSIACTSSDVRLFEFFKQKMTEQYSWRGQKYSKTEAKWFEIVITNFYNSSKALAFFGTPAALADNVQHLYNAYLGKYNRKYSKNAQSYALKNFKPIFEALEQTLNKNEDSK